MSRILGEILGYDPAYLGTVIAELERSNDGHAIDVALLGEMIARSSSLHRALKLDPADTTPQELYMVLRSRVADDNQRLAGAMGGVHPNAVSEMTPLILKAVRAHVGKRHCWAMKTSVAKRLLKTHPPKTTMKALGYRSVDSLLKHEPTAQLMAAVRYIEMPAWNQALTKSYDSLTAADFESRPIEVAAIDKLAYIQPFESSHRRHHLVVHSKEMGVVAIVPTREKVIRGYTLRTVTLLLHYIAEISMMSSLLKYRHAGAEYGSAIVDSLVGDTTGHVTLADHPVHWRSIHHHTAGKDYDMGPHMDDSDWEHESANDAVARLVETMVMWARVGHIAKHSAEPVGYNVIDLAIDESDDVSFAARSLHYVRRELETELISRYLNVTPLRRLVFHRLGIE